MFGYTLADSADAQAFEAAARLVRERLHFAQVGAVLADVDGSLCQRFADGEDSIELCCDAQVNGVFLCSTRKLDIPSLREWQEYVR